MHDAAFIIRHLPHVRLVIYLCKFSSQVAYHTPPRFPTDAIECIRKGASLLFQQLGLCDFARIDGWFLPYPVQMLSSTGSTNRFGNTELGTVIFTDINLVSSVFFFFFLFEIHMLYTLSYESRARFICSL